MLASLLAVASCSGVDQTGPQPLPLNGSWRQSGDLREAATGNRHINLGSFSLAQSGADFGGTGSQGIDAFCTTANSTRYNGPLADPTTFDVAGRLTGCSVSFSRTDALASCEYTGSFVEGRRNPMTGTATCRYSKDNVEHVFEGQWQADKL